nr:immunoglobulin light chain junction region [Macaca mulatta]
DYYSLIWHNNAWLF